MSKRKRKRKPTPEPATPEPVTPEPVTPEPAASEPATPDPEPVAPEPTPAATFDHLCSRHADTLIRQAYLLTGRPRLARRAVERAFQQAWQKWPEVAVDADPAGWVRAAAYEYALSPWRGLRPRRRVAVKKAGPPEDRALLRAFLELPVAYRRTLLLHDGVGLGLYETAAEVEASTAAAAGRLMHARERLAERLPELGLAGRSPVLQGEMLRVRLGKLAAAQKVTLPAPRAVRTGSARTVRWTTGAALGLTGLVATATVVTVFTAPARYTPPSQRPTAKPATKAATQPATKPSAPAVEAGHEGGRKPPAVRKTPGGHGYLPAEARLSPGLR
ncbi:hypothetical protein [Streptomyces sp. NPDC101150]|uniref:RNA polymerase sigma factor n=1 Tax=Streptomyces sp. NPDC101150 TaxID=3366114 RepID=UPI0037F4A9BA